MNKLSNLTTMKTFKYFFVSLSIILLSTIGNTQNLSGLEIMKKFEKQDKTKDTKAEISMTLINDKGSKRERDLSVWSKTDESDNYKQFIKILSPSDVAGTGFLAIDNEGKEDNWLYLPALRKTRRIVGSDKTGNFIGSDFTYEDFGSEEIEDFEYKNLGEETIGQNKTWKIEAIAKNPEKLKETGYSKRILWIDQNNHLILKADLYDKDGSYAKKMTTEDIKTVGSTGKYRPYKITMENIQKGTKTELIFKDIQIDKGVDDTYFSIRNLQRGM